MTYRPRLRSIRGALLLGSAFAALVLSGPADAQTLEAALARAYQTNPTLDAQRAQLRATDELVPQALSGYRPTIDATGSIGRQRTDAELDDTSRTANSTPRSAGIELNQPLYRGGQTEASLRSAEARVQAQRANLLSTEQDVLLTAASAYLDVVRDQSVLELNRNNETVLRRQLDASRDRFNVGEITRTDVSQAEARLARASSDRIQAEGQLRASRAAYQRAIGELPGVLTAPRPRFQLPATLDEVIALSQSNNPAVAAAEYGELAANASVDQIESEGNPQVGLSAGFSRNYDTSSFDRADTTSITANLRIPLYSAGLLSARVREAKHSANQARIQIEGARRQVVENAIRAWEALTTARAAIESRRSQVRAAEIALEGVRQEAQVGSRTTLDTLNAEQELLDARVTLVSAERDETVAAFQVLAATGQLNARQLTLPVEYYNFDNHYREVRGKWWGTDIRK
ncbi:TolC family outer membrane protein [Arenibaculum pallidiluteum]|uniref:TolC family outer membrane protein n=1 Tax=Arenibaculum pallidiluteum TaxID=2812559 RepID=UPI001A9686CF|nr:TolC family outer membrane protein [Arenibaculum pallidiluteum]